MAEPNTETLLSVSSLTVDISTEQGALRAVEDVSFTLGRREVLGVVGETGCGKSITALSLMGLLPRRARVVKGECRLSGTDLFSLPEHKLQELRGKQIAMIFQDPLTSLNPLMTVGSQLIESMRLHGTRERRECRARAIELLNLVRIPGAEAQLRSYPHELSGGMRQRIMIAMAIANRPDVLIADEPTTALDVTTQAQVMATLRAAQEEVGSGLVLITHDLAVVAEQAQRIAVMYHGKIIEYGPTDKLLSAPAHPYTRALLRCRPQLGTGRVPIPIPGAPPRPFEQLAGCSFAPRCDRVDASSGCSTREPALEPLPQTSDRVVACFRALPLAAGLTDVRARDERARDTLPVVTVTALHKEFGRRGGVLHRKGAPVQAVRGIDLAIRRGETLAVAGESGCGKSTAARAILRLVEPTSGSVSILESDVLRLSSSELREFRRSAQIVLQDPYSALDPRKTIGESIGEPLRVHGVARGQREIERVNELLRAVGLHPEHGRRFPNELSGGQRQRVCIARAIGLSPSLLVLDEPVSALDVSVQAQILALLLDLQSQSNMAYLFITHDLAVVRAIADRVAIIYLGLVVEEGSVESVFNRPRHPYTQTLLQAVPDTGRVSGAFGQTIGDPPDPSHPPSGCSYAPRCERATQECHQAAPQLHAPDSLEDGRYACYHPLPSESVAMP